MGFWDNTPQSAVPRSNVAPYGLGAPGGAFPNGPAPAGGDESPVRRLQVQDQWGRSPSDPQYGMPPGGDQRGQTPGSGAGTGNPTDPAYFRAKLVEWANANNRPDIAAQPDYWVNAYMKGGGWDNAGNTAALIARIQGTDQSGNEQSTHGGGMGGGGAFGGAVGALGDFGAFTKPYTGSFNAPTFQAPSGLSLENDPGYQARMKFGTDAIQNSAAAKGTLLTGGTLKALTQYGQDYGSNEYANVYNRALQGSQLGYNQALSGFQQNYDIFRNNQTDPFNKLYNVTNLGLNAAGQAVGAGSTYGNQIGQRASQYGQNQQ